jgi:hypothetical protein
MENDMGSKGNSKWKGKFTKNQKFGKWTVVDDAVIVDHEAKIKCRCNCGTERYVAVLTLVRGISTRCSNCGNSKEQHSGSNNGNWKGVGQVPGYYLNRRKLDPSTKMEASQLIEQQKFKCALTGLPISFADKSASLDRIDSNKPYVKGNIQWVHKDVNIMKNGYNLDYFIKMCKLIADYNKDLNVSDATNKFIFGSKTGEMIHD